MVGALAGQCLRVVLSALETGELVVAALLPGCKVESTIFLACHISGVIVFASPFLYEDTSCLAFSRPEDETNSVLLSC